MDEIVNLLLIEELENVEFVEEMEPRDLENPVDVLTDTEFKRLFRVDKILFEYIINIVTPYMKQKMRPTDIDISLKVLTALRFLATGSYQLDIGSNVNLNLSQSSVSRCIKEFINALNRPEIFQQWVKFPGNIPELNTVRRRFFEKYEFPGIIGCIDCTHIAIFPPNNDDPQYPEHVYVNRKGYHSINVQLICDADLRILSVNARFPGSSHDSFIWNSSNIRRAVQTLHQNGHTDYFLLGDSGYPLRSYLLTPIIPEPEPGTPEFRYNNAHKQIRSIIERCNGVLKMRFRCLFKHRVLHYKPEIACKIINACAVLHNMCIDYNLDFPDDNEEGEEQDYGIMNNDPAEENNVRHVNPELAQGRLAQRRIINQNFM